MRDSLVGMLPHVESEQRSVCLRHDALHQGIVLYHTSSEIAIINIFVDSFGNFCPSHGHCTAPSPLHLGALRMKVFLKGPQMQSGRIQRSNLGPKTHHLTTMELLTWFGVVVMTRSPCESNPSHVHPLPKTDSAASLNLHQNTSLYSQRVGRIMY